MRKLKLVMGSKSGQLGNRLFSFSHFIANSIDYGYALHNPNFDEYCPYFLSTSNHDFSGYPITVQDGKLKIFRQEKPADGIPFWMRGLYLSPYHKIVAIQGNCDLRSEAFTRLLTSRRTLVAYGWLFRDYKGFEQHAPLLRKIFAPIEEHANKVIEVIATCRKKEKTLVGVHIRKGDYRTFAGGRYYYDNKVYALKMQQMQELLNQKGQDVAFLICSNEPCQHLDYFKGLDITLGSGHLIEDLYSLSQCDYLIGPPSTYSMWASFYGNVPLLSLKEPTHSIDLKDFQVNKG